jgi:hypothetical protein
VSVTYDVLKQEEETKMAEEKNLPKQILPHEYGCEIILQNTSVDIAKDSSFPNDAYLIWYVLDNVQYLDLVRGKRVSIFDLYYDTYGKRAVQKIDFGYGRVNPKLWGYKQPEKKKKR